MRRRTLSNKTAFLIVISIIVVLYLTLEFKHFQNTQSGGDVKNNDGTGGDGDGGGGGGANSEDVNIKATEREDDFQVKMDALRKEVNVKAKSLKSGFGKLDLLLVVFNNNEDLSWLAEQDYPFVICNRNSEEPPCGIKKGNEASAYLMFIRANWNDLPKKIAFVKGDLQPPNKLEKINCSLQKLPEVDYIGLNNRLISSKDCRCTPAFRKLWQDMVWPIYVRLLPKEIKTDGGNQFLLSRRIIKTQPFQLYEDLYDYTIGKRFNGSVYGDGKLIEFLWSVLVQQPDLLTSQEVCDSIYYPEEE